MENVVLASFRFTVWFFPFFIWYWYDVHVQKMRGHLLRTLLLSTPLSLSLSSPPSSPPSSLPVGFFSTRIKSFTCPCRVYLQIYYLSRPKHDDTESMNPSRGDVVAWTPCVPPSTTTSVVSLAMSTVFDAKSFETSTVPVTTSFVKSIGALTMFVNISVPSVMMD